ncbi:MAG: hypothetical protein HY887_06540, partial [Deltaproteobacteria bacterium]|nr:hypothetical protein [Deltaproteobacteria bacterium]
MRRKRVVIASLVSCTVIGAVLAFVLPPVYRSTTLILVEQQQVPESYVAATVKTPFGQRLNTIRQQIMSRTRLERIINDFHLYRGADEGAFSSIKGLFKGAAKEPRSLEGALERMAQDIEVKVTGEKKAEDAFSITYSGKDPYITMQVTNTLAALFIEENLKAREQYVEGTTDFLANELEKAKKDLEAQERDVRSFKEKYMGGLPQQLEANLRTLDRLQMEMQAAALEIKNAQDKKTLLEQQSGQALQASTGLPVSKLAVELERLQNELASLQTIYKENYPDVVTAKMRIKEIKESLAKGAAGDSENNQPPLSAASGSLDANNSILAVNSQIDALRKREAEIRKQIEIYQRRVEDTPANEQRLADIRRDYDISLKNYQALLEKKLNARLAENLEKREKGERFMVIDSANLPERPYKPNRPLVVFFGL